MYEISMNYLYISKNMFVQNSIEPTFDAIDIDGVLVHIKFLTGLWVIRLYLFCAKIIYTALTECQFSCINLNTDCFVIPYFNGVTEVLHGI